MTTEIITVIISSLGGGVAFWGAVKAGLIKIQIGKNGNGTKKEIEDLHKHAEIANTEMGEINKKFDRLIDFAEKENEQHAEMLFILRDLKK